MNPPEEREIPGGFIRFELHSRHIYSLRALGAPAVRRLAGGAKAGGMGKSGEGVEARGAEQEYEKGYVAKICKTQCHFRRFLAIFCHGGASSTATTMATLQNVTKGY